MNGYAELLGDHNRLIRSQVEWVAYMLAAIDVHEITYKKEFWPEGMSKIEKTALIERVAQSLMEDADGGFIDLFRVASG
jgi:hypothetical protein